MASYKVIIGVRKHPYHFLASSRFSEDVASCWKACCSAKFTCVAIGYQIKEDEMCDTRSVRGDTRNADRILVLMKRILGRTSCRWKDNIKMVLR
jgi:hypothetical protein